MPAHIGPYTLHTIETGRFRLDGGAMFGIVPKPLWERRIPADERNRIPLNMRCLLIEGPERLILIDNGIGSTYGDKFADIYGIDHEYAELHRSLAAAGFDANEVTDVILTHLHFDHCGGTTKRAGDDWVLAFPNARHHIQRAHWRWANDPTPKEENSFLASNFALLEATDQLNLLDGSQDLWGGISVELVNGHTEAQQIVKIAAEGDDTLIYVADLLPTTAHLGPAWTMAYDVRPLVTIEEKSDFLERALADEWTLFFEHDPDVAIANVERSEKGITTVDPRPLDAL